MANPVMDQSNAQTSAFGTFTFTTKNITVGSTVIIVLGEYDSSVTETITGIKVGSTAQPNAKVLLFPQTLGGGSAQGCALILIPNVQVSGQDTVTWTYSGSSVIALWGCSVLNMGTNPQLDAAHVTNTGTGSPNSTGTTPAQQAAVAFVLWATSDYNGTSATPSGTTWAGGTDLGIASHLSIGWEVTTSAGGTFSASQTTGGTAGWAGYIAAIVPNSDNNLTAGALNMSPAQVAGTLHNPVNLSAGALLASPVQLAGTVNNEGAQSNLSGSILVSPAQLSGTVNNPVNILAASLAMSAAQLGGELATQKNVTAAALLASTAQVAGTLHNPVNVLSAALQAATAQLSGTPGIATQKNLTSAQFSMSTAQLAGIVGSGDESLYVNGVNIMSCAAQFTPDLSGILFVPLVRTADIAVPGRQGLVRVPRKLYDRAQIPMTIWVRGMNPNNTYPPLAVRDQVFYRNLDTLMQMFAVSGEVTLTHVTPAGGTREITGQVLQAWAPARYAWSSQATGNLQVIIECTGVFWREPTTVTSTISASASPKSQSLAEQDGSTAPIEDALVTFEGPCTNPTLTTADGWFVKYQAALTSGQFLTVDAGDFSLTAVGFTPDYSKLVHAGLGPWIVFNPQPLGTGGPVVTYSYNGGGSSVCTVVAQRAFLGG